MPLGEAPGAVLMDLASREPIATSGAGATRALRVDAGGVASEATLGAVAREATLQQVRDALAGTLAVSAQALPLPVGAATEATLEYARLLLLAIRDILAGTLTVAGSVAVPGVATETSLASVLAALQGTLTVGVSGTVTIHSEGSSTPTIYDPIPATTESTPAAPAKPGRKEMVIYNSSTTRKMYVKFAAGASPTSYTDVVAPNSRWVMPGDSKHEGVVHIAWEAGSADGSAHVTEW